VTGTVFADSSALVKLYADEPGADDVRRFPYLVVSQMARVEVPAALWRKQRMGEISAADAAVLVAAFEADYFGVTDEEPRFVVLAVTAGLLDDAARLVGVHGLRAYDAVQLASAVATRAAKGDGVVMASFDKALSAAAAAEGLALLPEV
jgi:predicted nucleic acid-binding protein